MYSLAAAIAATLVAPALSLQAVNITLDGATALHRYDGHGGLSAGASSRLLWDYSDPQRSQILDYLFKPQFGAGMHTLKVEIGGDGQSTDGSEPSHMHTRDDYSCERGYELWLLAEAKARNPAIVTYGLMWAAPGWINNGTFYGPDMITYALAWLDCVTNRTGGSKLDFLGLWNEAAQPDVDYLVQVRMRRGGSGACPPQLTRLRAAPQRPRRRGSCKHRHRHHGLARRDVPSRATSPCRAL